jgi:hypothetical protein
MAAHPNPRPDDLRLSTNHWLQIIQWFKNLSDDENWTIGYNVTKGY